MCLSVDSCCFGLWDLESGSKVIGAAQIALGAAAAVGGFAQSAWTGGAGGLVSIVLGVLLLVGASRRSRPSVVCWLIAVMVVIVIEVCDLVRVLAVLSMAVASPDETGQGEEDATDSRLRALLAAAFISFVVSVVDIYFWIVVQSYQRQLNVDAEAIKPIKEAAAAATP